jgi:hypothetical protein
MCCILPDEGCIILQDIHSGIYDNHAGAHTLVGKAYRQGFYWPTTISDIDSLIRCCEGCQFFAHQKHVSSQQLQTIPIMMRGWFLIFQEVEVGRLVEISTLVKKALNRRS